MVRGLPNSSLVQDLIKNNSLFAISELTCPPEVPGCATENRCLTCHASCATCQSTATHVGAWRWVSSVTRAILTPSVHLCSLISLSTQTNKTK
jgi:hypothetical protein